MKSTNKRIESYTYKKHTYKNVKTSKRSLYADASNFLGFIRSFFDNKHYIIAKDFFRLKKAGGVLILSFITMFSYGFNFPLDTEMLGGVDHASAISFEETAYAFNNSGYLSSDLYKVSKGDNYENISEDYLVKPGDNVSSIAKNFHLKVSTVLGVNDLGFGEIIKPGDELEIPVRDGVILNVTSGQSFASLSKKYDVSAKIIKRVNNKNDDYILQKDDKLIIPGVEYDIPAYNRSNNIYVAGRSSYYVPTKKVFNNAQGGRLLRPMNGGIITQGYHGGHLALDLAGKYGTNIFAAEAGVVKKMSLGSYGHGYGNYMIIDHGDGLETLYAHLSTVHVKLGDKLLRGQLIAKQGNTGRSTGPHLHFEVRYKGGKQNPHNWF